MAIHLDLFVVGVDVDLQNYLAAGSGWALGLRCCESTRCRQLRSKQPGVAVLRIYRNLYGFRYCHDVSRHWSEDLTCYYSLSAMTTNSKT